MRIKLVGANTTPRVEGLKELPGKSNYVVEPGADPGSITMRFEGADKLSLDPRGDLVIAMKEENVVKLRFLQNLENALILTALKCS